MGSYFPFGKYLLRLPQKPLKNGFLLLNDQINLMEEVKEPIFLEALEIASSSTYKALMKGVENERLLETLQKYYVRSSVRPTPFGLFSGISVGVFVSTDDTLLNCSFQKRSRLDFSVESRLLTKLIDVYNVKYIPNTSLYYVLDELRFIECVHAGELRKYSIQKILPNPILKELLIYCEPGRNIRELKFHLQLILPKKKDYSDLELNNFLKTLIENQVIVTCEEPKTSKENQLISVAKKNIVNESLGAINENVIDIYKMLHQYDLNHFANQQIRSKIKNKLRALNVINEKESPLHSDLFIDFSVNELNQKVVDSITKGIEILRVISPQISNNYLQEFRKEFNRRYNSKKIPLAYLFDNEIGLDFYKHRYGQFSFIDKLDFNTGNLKKELNISNRIRFFKEKITKLEMNNAQILYLTSKDLASLRAPMEVQLSPTFYAFIEKYEQQIFINSISGPSAANLISRFSQHNVDVEYLLAEITNYEKNYHVDKIVAEIIHIPQDRVVNILRSNIKREYEIVYLAGSSKDWSHQILIDDILVSIIDDRIVLESKRLKKEIIPVLSNAYNYELSELPIYNFLCQVQEQDSVSLGFEWDLYFEEYRFLPRIQYDEIIFSKARWLVSCDEILNSSLTKWRVKRGIPQFVQIVEHDNLLLINLDQPRSQNILLKNAKKNKSLVLVEFLYTETNGLLIDNERYANEFIIPFYCEK